VPGVVFGCGADVEDDDVAAAQASLELGAVIVCSCSRSPR
jgi:hypothetical protein